MFLSLLNEKETLKFLDLAVYMTDINAKPQDLKEDILVKIYREVGFINGYSFDNSKSIEETISYFINCNKVVKSIVYLNLVKISLVNDLYNTAEHQFLMTIQDKLEISSQRRKELMALAYEERDFREKVQRVLKDND